MQNRLPRARLLRLPFASLSILLLRAASATDGYLSDGVGAKTVGQAGVAIAWAQDALSAASNPAGTALVGNRVNLDVGWFIPSRSADIVGNAFGPNATYSGNGEKNFFIPSLGHSTRIADALSAGVAVYGNGTPNTQYDVNPHSRFGATGAAFARPSSRIISPSARRGAHRPAGSSAPSLRTLRKRRWAAADRFRRACLPEASAVARQTCISGSSSLAFPMPGGCRARATRMRSHAVCAREP